MMWNIDKVLLGAVVVFCGVLLFQAIDIKAPAGTFPVFVTATTGALAMFALGRAFLRPITEPFLPAGAGAIVLAGAIGLVVYVTAMTASYLVATPLFLFAGYLFLMPQRTIRSVALAAVVAVAMTAFTWLCFAYWLGVNLP